MIYCNFAVLLAERKLKISKVSEDTGISRTTLTALYYNHGKGVQMETINTICLYLDVDIGQLYTFLPFDLAVSTCRCTLPAGTAELSVFYSDKRHKNLFVDIPGIIHTEKGRDNLVYRIEADFYFDEAGQDSDECELYNKLICPAFSKLTGNIRAKLIQEMKDAVLSAIGERAISKDCSAFISLSPLTD